MEYGDFRIWIEAVTATNGAPTKPDSLAKPERGQEEYTIPDERIILRYTTALYEKHKKYLEYRAQGIVTESDAYVIAVNGFPLSYKWADPEIPRILKAIFPIGSLEVILDRKTAKVEAVRHQYRPRVYKSTGANVSTEFFVNDQYGGISAILHSYANACIGVPSFSGGLVNRKIQDHLGVDFIVAHNPLALRPVPHGLITATREYWATPIDDGYELCCHDTRDLNNSMAGDET